MRSETQRDDGKRPIEAPARDPSRGDTRRRRDYPLYFLFLAIVSFFLARIPALAHRRFDPDELQHSHAAWCVWKGMVPYRDFFEHHTPWYYYALRPFFRWFDVAGSFESARHFLLFGRGLSLVLTMLSVLLLILIGRLWDRRVGLLAGLLLVGQPTFFQKTLEIRPDVLALPFFLGGLWLLLRGLAIGVALSKRSLRYFLGGGLAIGAAIMCTQKMLFVLPGTLAGLALWALCSGRTENGTGRGLPSRVLLTLAFVLGIGVPGALTWAAFAWHHGGGEFIADNFLLNSKWPRAVGGQLVRVKDDSWPVLLLSLLGASVALHRFFRAEQRQYGGLLLLCIVLGLVAGILVVPVAHRQYYLMPLPIACLFAAQGLLFLIELAAARTRAWLLVIAMIPLSVLPVRRLSESFTERNDQQLARLRYVLERTQPTDVVMDGWEGTGVFRPHALPHYFLHEEALAMLSRAQVDAYVDALEQGKIRPRLIALDERLVTLGSRFLRFVGENYVSSDGFFYFRKT
jgi:hypothetical protein